jgi:chromosome partitioning protein
MMAMDILTIASQKGGTGKSTLTAHLAVEAERRGAGPVAVVDTDPQGSLAVARLAEHMMALQRARVNLVVIDTPPALLDTICTAIAVADVVLIPARPSPHDLRAVGVIVEMAEAASRPFGFVVNGATPRTTIALQAVQALAQHGLEAPVMLHQRIDFAGSMVDGRTVGEINPQSRSAQEITGLWKYVYMQIRKYRRSP